MGGGVVVAVGGCVPRIVGGTEYGGGNDGIKVWYFLSWITCLDGRSKIGVSIAIIVERGKGGFPWLVHVHLPPERLEGKDLYGGGRFSLLVHPVLPEDLVPAQDKARDFSSTAGIPCH